MVNSDIIKFIEKFSKLYDKYDLETILDFDKFIENMYISNDYSIYELAKCIHVINHYISICLINNKPCLHLVSLRIKAHKLIKRKYQEGYDYINENKIILGLKKSKINFVEQKPRKFNNVKYCKEEFEYYKKFIWKTSVIKLSDLGRPIDLP